MASSFEENRISDTAEGAVDKIEDAAHAVSSKWRSLSGKAKGIIAGGTAAATLGGVGLGMLASDHEEELSPEQLQSGQLNYNRGDMPMQDGTGKPALLNYFDADTPASEQVLKVSLATHLPQAFRDGQQMGEYLDTIENSAQSHSYHTEIYYTTDCHTVNDQTHCDQTMHTRQVRDNHYYRYDLDIEDDFEPVNAAQEQKVREYFKEFTRLTGIRVEVARDADDAHITIANYRNEPNYYSGSLDDVDPDTIATYPEGSQAKNAPSFKRNLIVMNERNWGDDHHLMDQIGRPLGFADGKVNVVTLRAELAKLGFPVAPLNAQDTTYTLKSGVKAGSLVPDNILIDNGGNDTLVTTEKNDTVVSEAGYCGRLDTPTNKLTNVFGDGKQYCIAEGEFELVQAGAGNDLIIAARGGRQTIEPGAGNDRILFFQPGIGDTTILSHSGEAGENVLYLHDANVFGGDVSARAEGNGVVLDFNAFSGREVGHITLPEQLAGGGIDKLVVVDDKGETIFEKDVSGITTAEQWQDEVVEPMEKKVDDHHRGKSQEEAARWRNNVRRRREEEPDLEGPFI